MQLFRFQTVPLPNFEQEITERTEILTPITLVASVLPSAYLFASGKISRLIPSVTFLSWKLMSSPTGTFRSLV
jgi:hypothetical protein